ncbi:MAG: chemotaxis protein CheR, partial [Nitrosospira sp.]|nr:chemotaxis protein CheR [Nitrosospira sp.]
MANLDAVDVADRNTREYDFTDGDFERIRKLIYAHAGISLSARKQDMVYSRLARRLREKGMTRFDDYLQQLEAGDTHEWQAFTNALTTNLTSFYREAHHFPILAEHLMRRRRASHEPIVIWCSAASTGEEPYTIAM